jgi:hypothetical protein
VAQTTKNTPGIDLDDDGYVIATRLSMEHYAAQEHPGRLIAWSPNGESYSANAGDYWAVDSEEWLEDSDGVPMVLAYVMPERVEPITLDADGCDHCHSGWELMETIREQFAANLAKIAYASYAPERQARLKGSHNPADALFTRGEVEQLLREVRDAQLERIAAQCA